MSGPEEMRDLLRDYVYALNKAYLGHVAHLPPAERAALPLAGGGSPVTVAVAAGRELHLIATPEPLPMPVGQEVELNDEYAGVSWAVRFYDATILPALGVLPAGAGGGDDPTAVRQVLGVADVIYHLSVSIGGGLTAHHAQHAGVALANQHAAAARDRDTLRRAFPGRAQWVEEFAVCERLGLVLAGGLLARGIAAGTGTADLTGLEAAIAAGDLAGVRRVLLALTPSREARGRGR